MREIRTSGSMSGAWKRKRQIGLRHRPRNERSANGDSPIPSPPRHVSTLPEFSDVPPETLRHRGRHGNEARSAAIYLSRKLTDAGGRQIGAYFGGVGPSAVSNTARQVQQDRKQSRRLNAQLTQTEAALHEK